MKSLYSCSALSLAYPYFCCKSPRSFSLFPSTWVRSSSVSLPHFSLTPPLISFHFPFRTSSFMFALLFFHPPDFRHSILGARGRNVGSVAPLFFHYPVRHRSLVANFEALQRLRIFNFNRFFITQDIRDAYCAPINLCNDTLEFISRGNTKACKTQGKY